MPVFRENIRLKTAGLCSIVDITSQVAAILEKSGISQGICSVSLVGSTGAISTVEYEPGLLQDIPRLLEKLIPSGIPYEHDKTWGDGNGFSHLRSFLLKTSLAVSFADRQLDLGTWQQIVFLDFDNRPRNRELIVQIVGE